MNVTGIILAGGKSSRMGEDKGLILLEEIPMVEHIIRVFQSLNIPIIISANTEEYKKFGFPVYQDVIKDKGPAGGIFTALTHTKTLTNVIVSCDSPYITKELLQFLLDNHKNHQVTYPIHQNKIHPLIGIYQKEIARDFERNIIANRLKLRTILKEMDNNELEIPASILTHNGRCLSNINTKEELNKFIK